MTVLSMVDFIRSIDMGVSIYIDLRHPYSQGDLSQYLANPRYTSVSYGCHRAIYIPADRVDEIEVRQDGVFYDELFLDHRVISGVYDTSGTYGHDFITHVDSKKNPLALISSN